MTSRWQSWGVYGAVGSGAEVNERTQRQKGGGVQINWGQC